MIREIIFSAYKKGANRFRASSFLGLNPVSIANWYLLPLLRPQSVSVHGNKLLLDEEDSLRLSLYPYEPMESRLLKLETGSGKTVVDVGAYIGHHTLLLAKAVGAHGRVFAFEPAERNMQI